MKAADGPLDLESADMTLALSCEGDNGESPNDHSTGIPNPNRRPTWLQIQKDRKAAATVPLCIRENLAEEFDKYCAEPTVSEEINPFNWWAMNMTRYPNVSFVARQYLAVPATSVASERVFSKCGLVCSDRRSALKPQHVEQLVVLSHNLNV